MRWKGELPCDDLTGHLAASFTELPSETKVGYLELTVGRDQKVIRFQILRWEPVSVNRLIAEAQTHTMQHTVSVDVLQSAQRHRHPALYIRILNDECFISDDRFEVGVEEFQDEVDVLFDREDV